MHTFRVGDAKIEDRFRKIRDRMAPWQSDRGVSKKLKGTTLHASPTLTIGGTSPLFHTFGYAFNNHCPLVVTPDSVWLTILTGLTHHIDTDPEGLRHHFVQHDGKKELTVEIWAPGIKDVPGDLWEAAIHGNSPNLVTPPFAAQLKDALNPKKFDLLVCGFSTTTPADRISSEVALMGAMKHWFEYKMMLLCGLSTVTVEGTTEDWQDIIARTTCLNEFGLGWWTASLLPVLEQIKLSCDGMYDLEFWKAAYLEHRMGSGGDHNVSGWVNAFYPYVAGEGKNNEGKMRQNPYVGWEKGNHGLDSNDFPLGLVSAPVAVDDHGMVHKCEFYGGLVGVSIGRDFAVRPESGYAMQLLE